MQHEQRPVFRMVTSAGEAEEHLRVIRQAMEPSTRHSTLSGLSGVVVGLLALAGCLLTQTVVRGSRLAFVALSLRGAVEPGFPFVAGRRLCAHQTTRSPLGRHLIRAAAPGVLAALALSLFYFNYPGLSGGYLYGFWMLCYAVSLLSVGMFSVREVSILGWAFLAAGALTLMLPRGAVVTPALMMALTFGGFHICYGVWMGRKYGW